VKLTDKQQRFVDEYLIDLNATQAAIRAGYSTKTAAVTGSKLLTNANIRACIDEAIAQQSRRTGITADRVIRELARVALLNPKNVVDTDSARVLPDALDDDLAAISSVKIKTSSTEQGDSLEREVKFCDKLKALELLGRHLGMFNDKLNITGEGVVQIVDDLRKTE
jgi:phage terminase small subunit